MRYLLFLFLLSSCSFGPFKKDNEKSPPTIFEELTTRKNLYCELSRPDYDATKAISSGCDAALWTSLHGLACDYVTVSQFESPVDQGRLCRRPGCMCFVNGQDQGSKSGFSKDMATGMQLYLAIKPDAPLTQRIVDYGANNSWIVCDAVNDLERAARCAMSPKIISRWYDILGKAGGLRQGEDDATLGKEGFQKHLDILSILAEDTIYGAISDLSLGTLEKWAKDAPSNLLFQAVYARFTGGDLEKIGEDLLAKFPKDRLPTSSDWCAEYLYQRDEVINGVKTSDWLPCNDGKMHTGTDFLLTAWVLQYE